MEPLKIKNYRLNRCRCGKAPKMCLNDHNVTVSCKCGKLLSVAISKRTQYDIYKLVAKLQKGWNNRGSDGSIY